MNRLLTRFFETFFGGTCMRSCLQLCLSTCISEGDTHKFEYIRSLTNDFVKGAGLFDLIRQYDKYDNNIRYEFKTLWIEALKLGCPYNDEVCIKNGWKGILNSDKYFTDVDRICDFYKILRERRSLNKNESY